MQEDNALPSGRAAAPLALRRGGWLALPAAPTDAAALQLVGRWRGKRGQLDWRRPRVLQVEPWNQTVAGRVTSAFWLAEIQPVDAKLGNDAVFDGTVQWAGVAGPLGAPQPLQLRLAPTVQAIALDMGPAFESALAEFGLSAFADPLRVLTLERLRRHFAPWSVAVLAKPPRDLHEYVTVGFYANDPNGLGLLGNDNSVGKDTGNLRLDEQLAGFDADRANRGEPGYGGVFVSEIFQFSYQLRPWADASSKDFDALFGPFAPRLGGKPPKAMPLATLAALANLLAGTAAHEVGHALGLASGTAAYHHDGSQAGWLMNGGAERSFAERAELPGAPPVQWGAPDAGYLDQILPR